MIPPAESRIGRFAQVKENDWNRALPCTPPAAHRRTEPKIRWASAVIEDLRRRKPQDSAAVSEELKGVRNRIQLLVPDTFFCPRNRRQ